jgi:hypothetical protein
MNDFTKEELIGLYGCCAAAYISGKINPQIPIQLRLKIQFMIDNYGTHETVLVRGEERLLSEFCNE